MEKLKQQIRESFFNPVLNFLPLLVYLVVDVFFGVDLAWKISSFVAVLSIVYLYISYKRVFYWSLTFILAFFLLTIISFLQPLFPVEVPIYHIGYELLIFLSLILFLVFRLPIQRQLLKIVSKLIPMSNNFNELNRFVWKFSAILLFCILADFAVFYNKLYETIYEQMVGFTAMSLYLFLVVSEYFRVHVIRAKLVLEEWWPIVTNQGKVIGSVQHLSSLNDENKYMHPIVRVLLIDKGLILLQKRSSDSLIFPGLWDTAITNHLKMGETIEECVQRTAKQRYSLTDLKYMYLSNYTIEHPKESHYAFLFVTCQQTELILNTSYIDQLKWWTQQQIEAEIDSGIFSANFIEEYDLLKRSGLLETEKCKCNCRLKDAIYHQSADLKIF